MINFAVDYEMLYKITAAVTPLPVDCGALCGRACCRPDKEDTLGVYLFPGEEKMFTGEEEWLRWEERDPAEDGFPPSWEYPVYFVRCRAPCPRDRRPLSCRFFPLAPHLLRDGTLLLIYETLVLPYTCPLIEKKVPLRQDFVEVVARCWRELLRDPRIRSLVAEDSRDREREGRSPGILWRSGRDRRLWRKDAF